MDLYNNFLHGLAFFASHVSVSRWKKSRNTIENASPYRFIGTVELQCLLYTSLQTLSTNVLGSFTYGVKISHHFHHHSGIHWHRS